MRKKSVHKAADLFIENHDDILKFLEEICNSNISAAHTSWAYDYAIIRLYRAFEDLILNCLVAVVNGNTEQLSITTGVPFPKHLTDEVCEYIIIGDGYFDFRGRDGLIKQLKRYLPTDHFLVDTIKKQKYRLHVDRLVALRNFAAHDSTVSKKRALDATKQERMSSSGSWLKRQDRFEALASSFYEMAGEIKGLAPF